MQYKSNDLWHSQILKVSKFKKKNILFVTNLFMIESQVEEARMQFPYLLFQSNETTKEIQIEFNEKVNCAFQIIFSLNYPNIAPEIYMIKPERCVVTPPIIQYWNPYFRIVDILEQLSFYSKISLPNMFQITEQDVSNALKKLNPNELMNPTTRLECIQQIPIVVNARQQIEISKRNIEDTNKDINNYKKRMDELREETQQIMYLENQEHSPDPKNSMTKAQARAYRINMISQKSKEKEEYCKKLIEDFKAGKMSLNEFMGIYSVQKEEEIRNRLIAEKMQNN